MDVKALITAAGLGKRFGALTKRTNKCLLRVDGKPIIVHIVEKFKRAGIKDIYVVCGYQNPSVEKHLKTRVRALYNPFYRVSGILGSFWEARHVIEGKAFLFTTSDHFFHPSVLQNLISKRTDIRIVVQKKKDYTKEDAKVIIRGIRVTKMGKDLPVKTANGEFGGMAYFSARASRLFFKELKHQFEKEDLHGYMMNILMVLSHKYSMPIHYSVCQENSRIEVDSVHDLIIARHMAQKFGPRRAK